MTVTIYKVDPSPPARAVLMLAELIKLDYKTVDIQVLQGEHLKPEYLAKNQLHTVPFLEDGDFSLSDSHAIITYLVSTYGGEKYASLYPADKKIRATIDSRLYFDASILFTTIKKIGAPIFFDKATTISEKQIADMNEVYGFIDKYLENTKYIATDHLTVADIACIATLSSAATVVPVDQKFTKLHKWWSSLKAEEWYKKINEPGVQKFGQLMKDYLEKNARS